MHNLKYFFGSHIGISNTENTSDKENRSGFVFGKRAKNGARGISGAMK
jgi:hypothetical protein